MNILLIAAWAFILLAVVAVAAYIVACVEVYLEQKRYFKNDKKIYQPVNWKAKNKTSEPKKKITSEIQFLLERMAQSPNKN